MKRILSYILVLIVSILCLCSCSDKSKDVSSIASIDNSEVSSEASSETSGSSGLQTNSKPKPTSSKVSNTSSEKPPIVDMANLSASVLENFTDEQLECVHKKADKFPENFISSDLGDCGRVIMSASSQEDAINNARDQFTTTNYDVAKCEIVSETDSYYVVYVKWVPKGEPNSKKYGEEKVVCFKKAVLDIEELNEGKITLQDKSLIKSIFDYCVYSQYYKLGGYKVLYSEVTENSNEFKYTVYFIGTVYGDKGIMDEVSLYKQVTVVEKSNKKFEREDKSRLKKIGIIGEGYDGDEGIVE